MSVINRFAILLKEKESQEQRKITYAEISSATGIGNSTLSRWARNRVDRFDAHTINLLCEFLSCEPGDLIIRIDQKQKLS